jgi:hypothetical protein
MAYEVNKADGNVLVNLIDGEIDNTSTSLNLLGKNYLGYGELIAENFVHLLENFANVTAPISPVTGQTWFDTYEDKLKLNVDNSNWKTIAFLAAQNSVPAVGTSIRGDFWYDTANNAIKIYTADVTLPGTNGNGWMNIGALQGTRETATGMAFLDLSDTTGSRHKVVAMYAMGVCVMIISSDEDFTIATSHAVPGFDEIGKGINMNTTGNDTNAQNPKAFKLRGISMEAEFADVAEIYVGDASYEAGTLVALGGVAEVTQTTEFGDTNIFGIVSTRPAYLMNARQKREKNALPIAVAGRIPVKVKGEVKRGNRLIAGDIPGVAQSAPADVAAWAIIGRSLGDFTGTGIGKVEAVIGAR